MIKPIPASLRKTLQVIKSNLEEIKIYDEMLSFYRNNLETKTVTKKYPSLLEYSLKILKTSYIIALYRLLDKDETSKTIKKLINSVKGLPTKNLKIDTNLHKKFIAKSDTYLKKITSIEKKLGPVRHKIYCHNSGKWRIKPEIKIDQTTEWLHTAEAIFTEAVELIGYSDYSKSIDINKEKLVKELGCLKNII